ncbi:MAG: trigger factor [Chloroflexi bacterium]|nr:trigger factor [Chloroflexota bacterium]
MPTPPLQTAAERLDDQRVRVRVEVPEEALKPAVDAVYRRWANEIKVPGFRKGKVPRPMIDARVGEGAVREEALRDALPELYREALRAEDIQAIAPPDIEVVEFEAGSPLVFEATVDVRPEIDLPDLSSIKVDAPSTEVTDEEMAAQLDRLRDRFAELETASREARRGDFVLIDLQGFRHGEPVEGASAPDYLYEVGSRSGPPKLDAELEGARAGAILKFNDRVVLGHDHDHSGGDDHDHVHEAEEISFSVLVKEVKAKKLPPLDDDFAKTAGEFETLEDLKEDLRTRLSQVKARLAADELRQLVLAALVDAVPFPAPEKLVETEFEHRLGIFEEDLRKAGLTMSEYGRQAQLTELEIRRDIRAQVERSVRAELLLEEIARREEVEVTEADIGQEVAGIMRRKALERAVEAADVSGRVPADA